MGTAGLNTKQTGITISEAVQSALQAYANSTYIALPATVQSYDKSKGTVNIKINVDIAKNDQAQPYPILESVNVLSLEGGGFGLTFPIKEGDQGVVICFDRDVNNWLFNGVESIPITEQQNSLNSVFFISGLRPQTSPQALLSDNETRWGRSGSLISNDGALISILSNAITIQADNESLIPLIQSGFNIIKGFLPPSGQVALQDVIDKLEVFNV